jgi:hypothetical protein
MEMPDDKLFFAPIWKITEKLYENQQTPNLPDQPIIAQPVKSPLRSARYAFCQPMVDQLLL